MKRTGIIIELDDNGGITIPHEVLKEAGIEYNDSVEMFSKGENIHLVKEK
ncbi:MAG: AbrB/MazE/SpoVT family DNA-binding domain-containing protein [Halanaerobiales bacterium]|nr:AbrB/MazE/SpoVT family DNA-binding domain-containing protein [Halanaerobiales bacterium]